MNRLKLSDLKKNTKFFKYKLFQVTEVEIESVNEYGLITIKRADNLKSSILEFDDELFYNNFESAKIRQVLDVHRLLNNTYTAKDSRETFLIEYYRTFMDVRDLEFFITSVTKSQLTEEEYWEYIRLIAIDYPEKVI